MEPTVTMSLSQFKEYESAKETLEKIIHSPEWYGIKKVAYSDGYFYFRISFSQACDEIEKSIKDVNDLAEKWRVKAGGRPNK